MSVRRPVRAPSPRLAEGLLAHLERVPADAAGVVEFEKLEGCATCPSVRMR